MKIAIIGYGKMGHMIEKIALRRGHEIVCIIDTDRDEWAKISQADVAIEFTTPSTAEANIRRAWAAGVPVVCGTTGFHGDIMMREEGTPGLIWKSNFSEGVAMVFEFVENAARNIFFKRLDYKASISETHHIHKLDAPSGTAKTMAETYARITHTIPEAIPIESVREGEVPGTHTMTLDSEEDTIIITHIAKGREGFALGAVLAAEELCNSKATIR